MAHEQFRQHGSVEKALAHLVEEMGEVMAAVGKTQRFGLESYNPLLPPEQRETNEQWLRREVDDLKLAITKLESEAGW
ncbi:MazG-like nucleotide pyrophosphohydrolase [Rhodobacter phage RcXuper]|nr:MazG-like nucleotide pyrophosphohydrolase [Rhodobacter phage RcXuper]